MKLNNRKLKKEINQKGYTVIENFYNKKKLSEIKKSLLDILNYVRPSKEKDLQKKYYKIKKLNPKLKSNFYDIAPYNIDMIKGIHTPELINFVKYFFKTKTLFTGRATITYMMRIMIRYYYPIKKQINLQEIVFYFGCRFGIQTLKLVV